MFRANGIKINICAYFKGKIYERKKFYTTLNDDYITKDDNKYYATNSFLRKG
jgi:hypothetical protein